MYHFDAIRSGQFGRTVDDFDFMAFKKPFDICRQLLNNLFLAGHHGGQIQTYPAGLDAVGGELFFGQVVVFTGIQQSFAGYAPDIQADAPQARLFFDTGDFQAELGGANRSHISAGTTAYDYQVVLFFISHHCILFKSPS